MSRQLLPRAWLVSIGGTLAAVLAGCGRDEVDRVVVSGHVTYQGQPIETGGIQFVPIEGTSGVATLVEIAAGDYVASAKGGLPVGSYRVEIMGFRRPTSADPRAGGGAVLSEAPREQYIPDKYNEKTQLTTTIEASTAPLTRDYSLSK
jgi:hypothetical protein